MISAPHTLGSVLGPLLFVMCIIPLSTLVSSLALNYHLYADDTELFLSFHPSDFHSIVIYLQNALQQISSWMTANLLTLTSSKTYLFLLDLNSNSLKYTTALSLQPTPLATLVLFSTNTLPSGIKSLHFLNLATITSMIHQYLDFKTASTIATSIIHSKLDYCNSLYHNLPNCQLNRLQQIQNSLARAVGLRFLNPLISQISPLAKGQQMHGIQTSLYHLQSSYNRST